MAGTGVVATGAGGVTGVAGTGVVTTGAGGVTGVAGVDGVLRPGGGGVVRVRVPAMVGCATTG